MVLKFEFRDTEDECCKVRLETTENPNAKRPYGIWAEIDCNGNKQEAEAKERFYTYEEAEEVIKMLCREKVTPCTLNDII